MKPLSFENLRRLVGAGKKKKDRAESSFKRSDSFKRISIRKNYLDRGGKGRNPLKAERRNAGCAVASVDVAASADPGSACTVPTISENVAEPVVIGYGQWIECIRAEDYESAGKECARSPSRDRKPPTPPPRKKYSSPSADSSLEILRFEKSPVFVRRRFRMSPPPSLKVLDPKNEERSDSALSISLGRVWMDAPMAMANAPRSLELPRPSSSSVDADVAARRAHHSLESALKDRRDDKPHCSRRFHNYPSRPLSPTPFVMPNPSAICRTLSSTTQTTSTSKTISSRGSLELLSTSKDSGFSFSISIPRLTDFGAPSSGGGGGFFRKKKANKPKPSVSRDGYFKRTSGAYKLGADSPKRGSIRRTSSRKVNSKGHFGKKKSYGGTARSDLYQVVISRPPRSLKSLKLDPMIFVPPEKRKTNNTMRKPARLEVQEIRDYCSPRDMKRSEEPAYDEDEGLYECISGDISDGSSDDDGRESRRIQFRDLSDNDADTEDETYAPLGVSPVPGRRPVRRRKSARKNVKYLVKPTIHRAPSTLKKNRKMTKKTGDITQKGYEKKRTRLLAPYVPKQTQARSSQSHSHYSPNTRARRRGNRRLTRNESRYHSEVRQEAVQQALAAMQNRPKPSLPMPSKRTSVMAKSPDRDHHDSASSSDDESVGGGDAGSTPERERVSSRGVQPLPPQSDTSSTGSARETPPQQRQIHRHTRLPNGGGGQTVWEEHKRNKHEITDLADVMHNLRPYSQPPDVTHNTAQSRRITPADRVNRYNSSRQSSDDGMGTVTSTGRWKVSAKIQQLLNTLKRPKRRPLPEFYEDDDIELEIAANPKDPNAPKPEGGTMTPAIGDQLVVPSGLPRNLEAAIQRYGSATYKAPVATVLDPNGKLSITLTYGKLLSRSQKVAYTLLNKSFSKPGDGTCLKCGDRIALVYPNNDPINFMCAFYGCMLAGIVPVPIEVPLTRRDAGSQQIGFLLGSCGIQVALTSEACLKGLPKTAAGEVVAFKGWPKLHWFVTEHLPKTPKDWQASPRLTDDTPAYIEYTTDRDGSVMGVTVTRSAMLSHCRMLTQSCNYTEGENMVCVLDFKRETGLWHSVLTSILNGMHVVFIPYALMKVNPASWMQMITKYRASVAVVKSRDLHWGLLATKDHKDISLSSLRLLLVGDGANPWSLSSCDQFLSVFQAKGLRPDAVCPCASSSECLTVSVRRPGRAGVNATGRGVLSMSGLSYGVVRVDQENSLTSLTLQDCGQVMPGCVIVVVKMEGPSYLCKTDEVGEICVSSEATGSQYWGLAGLTNSTFKVQALLADGKPLSDALYTRSGLLGFLGPGGLVFVCGSRDGLMTVTGRKHNADDIIATVLAVEPMKFIYRGRIAVFSIRVLRDERICVIAEQRPDCSEEESFQWMSRVLQAVDSIHQVGLYCLALVPPNYLPKTPLGGIHLSECKRRFLEGTLHPANVLLCPHTCVTNLPKPREVHSASGCVPDVGPASVMVGNIVQGNRLASAQGRDMGIQDEESDSARKYQFISEILRWRAVSTSEHVIFTLLNAKGGVAQLLTCSQLHKRAERVGSLLLERAKINTGDHVALIFPPGIDLICAFYGCLYVGAVPVTIRPPHPQNLQTTLPTVRMIVDVSKSVLVLSNQNVIKLLKSKEASNVVDIKSWPVTLDTDDMPKKKLTAMYRAPTAEMLAYLDFSVSTTGMLAGIKMSHAAVTSLCRSMKLACELYPSRHIALCLDPYCGLGFALWCLSSVYSGHHSILIPPSEVEVNPALWLSAVSQYRVRDTFCSYGVMELCTKGLGSSIQQLKSRGVSLACVRTCVVVAEERPRINLSTSFSKLFSALGLSPRAVSTSFGCRVNVAICLQGASSPEPSCVYVDLRALRNDRVSLVERGSPHSLCLLESGKLLPGVKVIIANPDTKGQCGDSHLGEIWVQCPHNASGYFSIYGEESEYGEHFNARLVTGSTGEVYARTGYLGFLRRTESVAGQTAPGMASEATDISDLSALTINPPPQDTSDLHDAVFVVGALDETIMLRGMRYHPIDIENSVMRCHKKIAECAVFTWTNLLVVVVELDGSESEALDLVPLVTNAVLEEHHLIVGVAVVVDPGVVPINSRGEKQRMHLRDGFLADQLDPIYVAYNM
ncbi:disco-interacting protein 2 homolog C-like isoform X2 [Macrosteles quadrilineatus]|uniref:disco-interacting protein 2 homolog C-like isoform X2 n=1 Tax=Macrosteles quadrilineatus TaxID=74068 RepID=UPI0023E1CC63|nr:disco-interacting protein 2 homolog C-like isoform X2 [Macrosteles quadrilineatus]